MSISQVRYTDRVDAERFLSLARIVALVMTFLPMGVFYWVASHQPPFSDEALAATAVALVIPFVTGLSRLAFLPRTIAIRDLSDHPMSRLFYGWALILSCVTSSLFWMRVAEARQAPTIFVALAVLWMMLLEAAYTRCKGVALFHDFRTRQGLTLKLTVRDPDARPKTYDVSIVISGTNTTDCAWLVKSALGQATLSYDDKKVETTPYYIPVAELDRRVAALRLQGIRIDGARGEPRRLFHDDAVLSACVQETV